MEKWVTVSELETGRDQETLSDFSVSASTSTSSGGLGNNSEIHFYAKRRYIQLWERLTNPFNDTSEGLLRVSGTGKVRFYVVCNGGVLASAYILTNVRDALLNATRHVISAIRHAANY